MTEDIAARFRRDTAEHTMVVLHDQGLYRHLSFSRPSPHSWMYWFELITVPNALIFRGDGESFVFSRVEDMFQFFRSPAGRINPGYWSEKLTDDFKRAMRYSEDVFRAWVQERVEENDDLPGLAEAVQREIFDEWDTSFEENAREALAQFRYWRPDRREPNLNSAALADLQFDSPDPEAFEDYHWWFLWACHAIVWGIAQYDAVKAVAA